MSVNTGSVIIPDIGELAVSHHWFVTIGGTGGVIVGQIIVTL